MDERLQLILNEGAEVTIKCTRSNAFVQIRKENEVFKGSSNNITKAIDKVLESFHGKDKNIRIERKRKERQREKQLNRAFGGVSSMGEVEYLLDAEDFGNEV